MSNHIIWIVPIIAVPFAFIATLLLIFLSRKFNLFKNNIEKAPLVGGLAIYTVLFLLTLIFEMPKKIESIVFISSIIVLTGFLDDIIILSAKLRLLIHLFASLLLIYVTNLYIIDISFILFENKDSLSIIGIIITLLIVIGLTNGFNFIDGIDGLSAGQALITIVLIVIIQAITDNYYQIFYLSILSALLLTYLMFNLSAFKFEKIFLGDAGSTLLGFTISWALIYFTQPPISTFNPIFAIWCVTLPVYDLFYVILKRISIKKSPMAGDRNHLHYKLVDEGLNKKFVLILYLIISFSISLIGIMISDFLDPLISFSFYFIFLILYCLFMFNFNSVIKFIKSYYL